MNALEARQRELHDYAEYLPNHPEWAEKYNLLRSQMNDFNQRVNKILERFNEKQFRSLIAILNSIETGDLDYIFNAWLNELKELGLLEADYA